ncbi:hypothetical protein [Gilliamella apicola]|uniref:Uncharacterized protein n=1 Tax=Gilliamella apicola TaxID=1196095 RepID=A0A2V4DU61_9GAMM|nr:hypothetical protein [Gilliamella apicola]PXZ04280.1 hypothetical protein DKK79_07925 [Gilliamella apicola]
MMPPFGANCVILFAVSLSQLAHPEMLSFSFNCRFRWINFLKLFGCTTIIVTLAVAGTIKDTLLATGTAIVFENIDKPN